MIASTPTSRSGVYYWKCDRADRFRTSIDRPPADLEQQYGAAVAAVAEALFPRQRIRVLPGGGQGNHVTFRVEGDRVRAFVRIDDGPEADDYIEAESAIMQRLRVDGLPVPAVWHFDASRREYPFSIQIIEFIPYPDLNVHFREGTLDQAIPSQLGRLIAHWQSLSGSGFGFLHTGALRTDGTWQGLHNRYPDYFITNLNEHLGYLVENQFLTSSETDDWKHLLRREAAQLNWDQGCLVHKDVAMWNLLGTEKEIRAIIDWDDAVLGDPMEDIALLGCFHDGRFLAEVLRGYQEIRPLPSEPVRRFWLHLARNLIVKAMIRVGMGYFERQDGFFLHSAGKGRSLREITTRRLQAAWHGLENLKEIESL